MSARGGFKLKLTEIGEIPADWEIKPISEVCHKPEYGYTQSASEKPLGPKFLRITDIKDDGVDWQQVPFCQCPENTVNDYLLRSGDILFARTGATTGKSFLVRSCPRAIFASYLIRLRAKQATDPEYLFQFFNSEPYWKQIRQKMVGSAQAGISATLLSTIKVPLSSIDEQRKIASVLSTVDDAIQKTDEIIAKTQQLKKGLMQQLLTRGIGHTKFKHTEIGDIPEEWSVARLAEITQNLDSKRVPVTEEERDKRAGTVPYYGASGQVGWIDGYIFDEPLLLVAEDGENLESRILPIAYCISGKSWVNNHAHALRVNKADLKFLMHYINLMDVSPYLSGSTRPKLNKSELARIRVPYPPLAEQRQIVEILSHVDEKMEKQRQRKELLGSLKRGVMQVLLTGKVRVKVD
jgi:type I restriction enzyme S subunit